MNGFNIVGLKEIVQILKNNSAAKKALDEKFDNENIMIIDYYNEEVSIGNSIEKTRKILWSEATTPMKNTSWLPIKTIHETNTKISASNIIGIVNPFPITFIQEIEGEKYFFKGEGTGPYELNDNDRNVKKISRKNQTKIGKELNIGPININFNESCEKTLTPEITYYFCSGNELFIFKEGNMFQVNKKSDIRINTISINSLVQWIQPYRIVIDTLSHGEKLSSNFIILSQPSFSITFASLYPITLKHEEKEIFVENRGKTIISLDTLPNYSLLSYLRVFVDENNLFSSKLPKVQINDPSTFLHSQKIKDLSEREFEYELYACNVLSYDKVLRIYVKPPFYMREFYINNIEQNPEKISVDTNTIVLPLPKYKCLKIKLIAREKIKL
ncbi:hypothetical protein IOK49_00200 [Fervidicoccus fontis]|uniref:Uncharacterized protein n=1 Tax=Fervidicoccus fontis TaxID=683846 RepID=A0A2J6N3H4_9CREN|nr:hypothetical protein [Fervidicoccus fontis]MBE9390511.1 hypothetical protein [Fervidicoccus fontis]PMB75860.1 MAG: hypothetical protein C0188_01380 [Fervidicoccus fontis]PMB77739.1 MAG: hypothetical protein C0177_02345 [Fervidicoccus fontis]HEW64281.1 hypothetical protein [Fervidicoccus fontis]